MRTCTIDLLDVVVCPEDFSRLVLYEKKEQNDEPSSAILVCPNCLHWYPIMNGIPIFYRDDERNPLEFRTLERMKDVIPKEIYFNGLPFNCSSVLTEHDLPQHFDYHPDFYDKLLDSKYIELVEANTYLDKLALQKGDVVLELGCGSGRMTLPILQRCDRVIAFDYSMNMLSALRRKLTEEIRKKIILVCGDISFLPFGNAQFKKVCSFQVLEHLPLTRREHAYQGIANILSQDGEFLFSVYNWSLAKRLFDVKENYPSDNFGKVQEQYWYCFSAEELQSEAQQFFRIDRLQGIRNIPARSIADKMGKIGLTTPLVLLDKLISKTTMGNLLGHLLLVQSRKKTLSGQ